MVRVRSQLDSLPYWTLPCEGQTGLAPGIQLQPGCLLKNTQGFCGCQRALCSFRRIAALVHPSPRSSPGTIVKRGNSNRSSYLPIQTIHRVPKLLQILWEAPLQLWVSQGSRSLQNGGRGGQGKGKVSGHVMIGKGIRAPTSPGLRSEERMLAIPGLDPGLSDGEHGESHPAMSLLSGSRPAFLEPPVFSLQTPACPHTASRTYHKPAHWSIEVVPRCRPRTRQSA